MCIINQKQIICCSRSINSQDNDNFLLTDLKSTPLWPWNVTKINQTWVMFSNQKTLEVCDVYRDLASKMSKKIIIVILNPSVTLKFGEGQAETGYV